jgi:long-chain fatty acid transport protein
MNHTTLRQSFKLGLLPMAVLLAATGPAMATNGYFAHGYGLKAKGMGGASQALSQDAFGGANNPASMVFAGSRLDLGVDLFMPKRDAERTGTGSPLDGKVESDQTSFYVPELGYNRMLGADKSIGLTVYGNGGLNTDYPQGSFNCGAPGGNNILCGSGRLGVDMMQLMFAPTYAMKLNESHALGASLLVGYQRFKAEGLQAFDNAQQSESPGSVTNNGYDSSTGLGVRLGWQGKVGSAVTLGASYSSRLHMGKFEKYKGLFAEQGSFDIPSNFGIGLSLTPMAGITVAVDVNRINYSEVASVGGPGAVQAQLGSAHGPGFGWRDINVFKLGAQWKASDALTVRAGYNKGQNPIAASDVTFNIVAPGVVTTHYTLGWTWAASATSEFTGAYMVAPRNSVSGASLFGNFPGFPASTETIGMKQSSFGLAWAWKY